MENSPEFVTVEKYAKLSVFLEKLSKRLDSIEKSLKGIDGRIEKIEDCLESGDSESSDDSHSESTNHGFGPAPAQDLRHPSGDSYTVVLSHGPYTVYRRAGQDEADWKRTQKHLLYQRIKFLNCTGVTGTPEQEEYLREMRDDWEKWKKDPRNPDFKVDATQSNP